MPGAVPMKVIKVGSSSQSRIAQACDRCRSKKIRCDGIRPCCSQCANVGFECRTSDKLSRRAFPRGYTESLEERVRALEAEARGLKDLLDEKDEKIDMLAKIHGPYQHHQPRLSPALTVSGCASPALESEGEVSRPKKDRFRVQASPLLLGVGNSDSCYMGPSSGRAFTESFKRKMQEHGKPCNDFNAEAFLQVQAFSPLASKTPSQNIKAPSRLFTDRCVNVYFQEWAPLFPVIHKPTFLLIYEEYVADPEKIKSDHKLAQLYLVFCVAALSNNEPDLEQLAVCELLWQQSIDAVLMDNTMTTLQCLVLALLYCTVRADYKRLQHYKGVAVGLSHRLGLHQSQKCFSFGTLTIETRKKVFWTLYTLDCFSAAGLGLPKLLKDDDVHAEYPVDTDDEYVTEKGFQPSLPGEHTRLSSALALFRASRILASVLEKLYPAASSYELSLQQMSALESDLEGWFESLATHLKLEFKQEKPSADMTSNRSPLLALAYHYIKILIFRQAIGSSLGSKASPALMTVSESSRRLVQICQLLEERDLSMSFCINKIAMLTLCGMTLLYQSVELKKGSKMRQDNERLVNSVIETVSKAKVAGLDDLQRVAGLLVSVHSVPKPAGRHASETDVVSHREMLRKMAHPQSMRTDMFQRASFDGTLKQQLDVPLSPLSLCSSTGYNLMPSRLSPTTCHGIERLILNAAPSSPPSPAQQQPFFATLQPQKAPEGWDALLGSLDGGQINIYDAMYSNVSQPPTTSSGWHHNHQVADGWSFNYGTMPSLSVSEDSVSTGGDEMSGGSASETGASSVGCGNGVVEYPGYMMEGLEGFGAM